MKRGGVDTTKKITSSQEYLHLTERAKKSPISDLADFEKFRNLKAENQMQALQEVREAHNDDDNSVALLRFSA